MDNGNKSLIRSIPFGSPGNLRTTWYKFGYWVCSASQNVLRRDDGGCTKEVLSYYQPVWTLGLTATEPPAAVAPVIYCLSEGLHPIDEQCGLHFSIVVLWVVCGLNLFKLLCICFVFLDKDKTHKSLVTMGDMVASFLKEEDTHTNSDMWTSTRRFFHQAGGWNRSINPRSAPTGGEKWFKACSRWQFSITILL